MTDQTEEIESLRKRVAQLERKVAREKRSREAAESILESKSRELYDALKNSERTRAQLKTLAQTDPLTGLANRRELAHQFDQHGTSRDVGLLSIDLNGFKQINDQWGHEAGDLILIEVAKRLNQTAREGDCVARLGGDEFVILCFGVRSNHQLDGLAARLLVAMSDPIPIGKFSTHCGASIGTAIGDSTSDLNDLLRSADRAMYREKAFNKPSVTQD